MLDGATQTVHTNMEYKLINIIVNDDYLDNEEWQICRIEPFLNDLTNTVKVFSICL